MISLTSFQASCQRGFLSQRSINSKPRGSSWMRNNGSPGPRLAQKGAGGEEAAISVLQAERENAPLDEISELEGEAIGGADGGDFALDRGSVERFTSSRICFHWWKRCSDSRWMVARMRLTES